MTQIAELALGRTGDVTCAHVSPSNAKK